MNSSSEVLRSACPLDCPDSCSLDVEVEDGRVVDLRGNHVHAFTRQYAKYSSHDADSTVGADVHNRAHSYFGNLIRNQTIAAQGKRQNHVVHTLITIPNGCKPQLCRIGLEKSRSRRMVGGGGTAKRRDKLLGTGAYNSN